MNTKPITPQNARKRKFLLVLPLLILPFATLLFWALGGGKNSATQAQDQMAKAGLNTQLPDASLKEDKGLNKLSYYEKAASDSAKLEELMKTDPYYLQYQEAHQDTTLWLREDQRRYPEGSLSSSPYRSGAYTDPNEARVYQKLEELNTAMNASTENGTPKASYKQNDPVQRTTISNADIDRLEKMMEQANGGAGEEDPEIRQLSEMMEKTMDIQHPERVKERIKEASLQQKEVVFPVQAEQPRLSISLLGGDNIKKADESCAQFYGLEDDPEGRAAQSSVLASVHGTQTLMSGSVVKLRLEQNISVGGEEIPHGTFIYGTAAMNRERLHVMIASIRSGVQVLPVKLKVFDLDGMEGIYVPHSMQREVLKGSTDNALQSLDLSTLDPRLKAQAANAGISAAKNLLSRKVKMEKVTLKGGYQVILQSF